jgi:tRNA-2-methylthio-N6-dimethylallyladenosine synthase
MLRIQSSGIRHGGRTSFVTANSEKQASKAVVRSYGCQMNVYDSGKISNFLGSEGVSITTELGEADIVVLNTCHIREKAAEKIYSEIGTLGEWKQARRAAGGSPIVAIAGCVAQAEGAEILRRQSLVDVVVGPQSYQKLPDLIMQARAGRKLVEIDFATAEKFDRLDRAAHTPAPTRAAVSAFLTIQEGCDKFCTFCVVPYTRGEEVCRTPASVLAEAQRLVADGARELVLLGQNVNAYSSIEDDRDWNLADLVAALSDIGDLERIRYTTSHPRDMSPDLIAAHRDMPKLMPFLHLPAQSGSDRILRAMNRRHTADHYRRLIGRIREARADMAFSTDIIVGFPGETAADFEATCALVEEIGFSSAFTFKYSIRAGTPGAEADDQIEEPVKHERLLALQALVERRRRPINASAVGSVVPVLFEKRGRHPGQIVGRSPTFQSVFASGDAALIGRTCDVRLTSAGPNSFAGAIVAASER